MQKLGQIQLEKTVTVKVECNLNDEIVVKNFKILMDCLKDLSQNHNDLASKFSQLSDRMSAVESHNQNTHKQISAEQKKDTEKQIKPQSSSTGQLSSSQKQNLLALVKKLQKVTGQHEKNILDNIKDINLLNKQVADLKDQLSKIKSHIGDNNNSVTDSKKQSQGNSGKDGKGGVGLDSINNINKQMQSNKQLTKKLNDDLDKVRMQLAALKEKFAKISDYHDKLIKDGNSKGADGSNGQSKAQDFSKVEIGQLREKIAILNKKTNNLQLLTNQLKNQTTLLGQGQQTLQNTCNNLIKQIQQLRQQLNNLSKNNKGDKKDSNSGINSNDDLKLIKMQIKQLQNQIQQLKKDNNNSKTSIDDEKRNRFDRGAYTHTKFKDESLKDLIARIEYLEKALGSKASIDDKNSDKLPLIKRNRAKDRDVSINEKSTSKKDVADIKAELQAWINNYLAEMKSKDNFQDIELKLQEIKNNLNRKADQQGLKKGLTFLQAKINQLYLFLTEPEGDDAMIVRKGFNCLSCSKKVQKLRGKLGPHINWNNMTATNYSPPKVGYSRHMAETSGEKEQDQM